MEIFFIAALVVFAGGLLFALKGFPKINKSSENKPAPPDDYYIKIGSEWFNVTGMVTKDLPNLTGSSYRWEMYVKKENALDTLYVKLLNLHSGQSAFVASRQLVYHYGNKRWNHLAGCPRSYMYGCLSDKIVNPIIRNAYSKIANLPGIPGQDVKNYRIV